MTSTSRGRGGAGPDLEHRVAALLGAKRGDEVAVAEAHRGDPPVLPGMRVGVLRVDGLVRPVEAAEAEVHDAGHGASSVRSTMTFQLTERRSVR